MPVSAAVLQLKVCQSQQLFENKKYASLSSCLTTKICQSQQLFENSTGNKRRNSRVTPRFPITLWNVSDRVQTNLLRTNNSVEGWRHAFQLSIDGLQPNVFKLMSHFLREHENTENKILKYNVGERSKAASKTKYL
nr:hypothetical protein BgiMline_005688 [Biomphalaria glabrata]